MREERIEGRGKPIFHRAPCRSGRVRVLERPRPLRTAATGRAPVRTALRRRGRGLHVDGDRAGREQVGAFGTPDDVVRAGQWPGVDGAPGHGTRQFLDQPVRPDAGDGAARVPGLLGDDQVAGVHAGGEARAEAGGQHGGAVERRVGQDPGDRALGRLRAHARTQDGDRPAGAAAVAGAQGEVLDARARRRSAAGTGRTVGSSAALHLGRGRLGRGLLGGGGDRRRVRFLGEGFAVHVPAQRGEREDLPVEVVVDGEVPGEAGPGEVGLVPGTVLPLGGGQPLDTAFDGLGLPLPAASGAISAQAVCEAVEALPAAPLPDVPVGAEVLAPAAVVILDGLQPGSPRGGRPGARWGVRRRSGRERRSRCRRRS